MTSPISPLEPDLPRPEASGGALPGSDDLARAEAPAVQPPPIIDNAPPASEPAQPAPPSPLPAFQHPPRVYPQAPPYSPGPAYPVPPGYVLMPLRPARPAIWPAFVIVASTIPATIALGIVVGFIMLIVLVSQGGGAGPGNAVERLTDFMSTPAGLLAILIPGQFVFLGAALLGAAVTRGSRWRDTLGLTRPRGSWWLTLLLVMATVAVHGCVSGTMWSIVPDDLMDMLLEQDPFVAAIASADDASLLVLITTLSLMPGLIEEMLFRGYLQRRLLLRWNPWLAILTSTGLFALVHLSLQTITVIPLGLWLGVIAWRTRSIWPCVFCHATNNAVAFGLFALRDVTETSEEMRAAWRAVLLVSVIALLVSIVVLWRVGGDAKTRSVAAAPM